MSHRKKLIAILISVAASIMLLISGCKADTVATVNGEKISRSELNERLMQKAGRQILDQLVMEKLILQEAKKSKINISDANVNKRIKEIKSQFPDEKSFAKNLKDNNLTLEQAKKQIKIQLISQKILEKSVKITDKEIKDYYKQNKNTLFGGKKLSKVKSAIKAQLTQNKQYGNKQTWFEGLKSKAKIKIDL